MSKRTMKFWSEGYDRGYYVGMQAGDTRAREDLDSLLKIRRAVGDSNASLVNKVDKRIETWLKPTA